MDIVIEILAQTWRLLAESAPYVILGLVLAGLLKAFLPEDFVARHLGGSSLASVAKAAVMGAPLPL